MAEIVESIDISRRPGDVFSYAADFSHFPEWQGGVVSVRREGTGNPAWPGHGLRQDCAHRLPQCHFGRACPDLLLAGKPCGHRHHLTVQVRHAQLKTVRHGHPVCLDQDVPGQPGVDLDIPARLAGNEPQRHRGRICHWTADPRPSGHSNGMELRS